MPSKPFRSRWHQFAETWEGVGTERVATARHGLPAGHGPKPQWIRTEIRPYGNPPSLCVGDATCFDLAALERVAFDDDGRSIRLTWERDGGVLAAASKLLGLSKPERFRFDSSNRYEDVAAAFGTAADALDVETNGRNRS